MQVQGAYHQQEKDVFRANILVENTMIVDTQQRVYDLVMFRVTRIFQFYWRSRPGHETSREKTCLGPGTLFYPQGVHK